ncbi:two-component sensor histidine kinase, partial [Streptomyces sp. SID7499]|nr:two-component sensor histidine kinase [Streptomyces sp. SID7499]
MRRFRALPLRSRLAMLVATAVAVAVAAVAAACWLTTRDRLTEQLDTTLSQVRLDGDAIGLLATS